MSIDIKEIARYGGLGSPALFLNGKVPTMGSVPSKKQLAEWFQKAG